MSSKPKTRPRTGTLAAAVRAACLGFACSYASLASAQYEALRFDETGLSPAEQRTRNNVSYGVILGSIAVHNASIPLGFVPEPFTSVPAEFAGIAADVGLKFTKAYLVAPPDLAAPPNAGGNCYFRFDLPQAATEFQNFLGLWPKLGNDALFRPHDTPLSFGILGTPQIVHAHTDVDLSVHGPTAGIRNDGDRDTVDEALPQVVMTPAGVHQIEWRADTKWYPLWDFVVPTTLAVVMAAMEFKFSKNIKQLTTQKSNVLELASVKSNPAELAAQLDKIDDAIRLYEKFDTRLLGADVLFTAADLAEPLTGQVIVKAFFDAKTSVSRSRLQQLTVYDVLAPTIATSDASPAFEAADLGGGRTSRYLPRMMELITASDACGRAITLTNDAPEFLPLGDTLVTWTVRDPGPTAPDRDHDGDGIADTQAFNSRTVTQLVRIEDTQAPIMVPPPGVVIESNASINLNNQALGQPLVVDLADLHPTVTRSTASVDGIVPPNTRTVVTWSAADDGTPPNVSTAQQLVTVKTPGTNTAPAAAPKTADTLTSKSVPIVLTGFDADVLPLTGSAGGAGIADPLQFRIESLPQNGEFVAPLYPFFIDDYRTDKVGGLIEYIESQPDAATLRQSYETAIATRNLENWLDMEFCNATPSQVAPVDFVFEPRYVQVTDDGEEYFFDNYFVCDPSVDTPWDLIPRISRWSAAGQFLGHVRIDDDGGGGIDPIEASFRFTGDGFLYFVNKSTGGEPVVSVHRCAAALTNQSNDPPVCGMQGGGYFGPIDGGDHSGNSAPQNAFIDSGRGVAYVTDGRRIDVHRLSNQQRVGILVDDAGVADLFGNSSCRIIEGTLFTDDMEVDTSGNLYVIDNDCNRIHKFTPSYFDENGVFVLGAYVGWMGRCNGSNNLACDVPNQRTKGYSCTAASACTVPASNGSRGNLVGQFRNPAFLAMDPNDVLYVADYGNNRIQRFGPDGTFAGQAQSTGNGINAAVDGAFVLGNMGPPKHVSVNSKRFFVVDQQERFVHVFDASPFTDVTSSTATVSYVSDFDFHTATDSFTYSVHDGLVSSNVAQVSIAVARNYRQPLPTAQTVTTDEDRAIAIVLNGTDPDGILARDFNGLDSLTFEIARQPEHGKLARGGTPPHGVTMDPGKDLWTYTPNRDFHGTDVFGFTVRDAFTDQTSDGPRSIPEPYGEAEPVDVAVTVNAVNDIPIVRLEPPQRVAAGFPVLLQGAVYDDLGADHAATVIWGDGRVERNGDAIVDDNGTPNETSDDEARLTGVVLSAEALEAVGSSPVMASHSYAQTGNRRITLCLRDAGRLEACDAVDVTVESLVAIGAELKVSHDEVVDGVPFDATIDVVNGRPSSGVTGLAAENVTVTLPIPPGLVASMYSPSQGSCSFALGRLQCALGTLANGAKASVNLRLKGNGTLLRSRGLSLDAEVRTTTPALDDAVLGSASFDLKAVTLDRDGDGLTNLFEGYYGVGDANADADGDGLTNRAELDNGTSPVAADTDGDGVADGAEVNTYGSDPLAEDSDGDGLADGAEVVTHQTNPADGDSDADGLRDDFELANGFDPRASDSDGDSDGDGLSDADEYANGTDYLAADSDGDTLSDGAEVNLHATDPTRADTDRDGLADQLELAAGTDLLKPDSDDDGLPDGAELTAGTSPLDADADNDGLPDGWEVRNGTNPLVANAGTDPDGDGILTAEELANGTDPLDADTDRDGLRDNVEALGGTNPRAADTDGDGLVDGDEVNIHLSDPRVADSDSDGLPDDWEVEHGLAPLANDAAADPDADGLVNRKEYAHDADPNVADTDGDGVADGAELAFQRFRNSGQLLGAALGEAVALGDLDDDGDLDAFVANRVGGSEIWLNDGDGTFALDPANALNDAEALDVDLADVDGDGNLDAVLAHPAQPNTLWINGAGADAPGVFSLSAQSVGGGVSDGIEFGTRFKPAHGGPALAVANWFGTNEAFTFTNGAPLQLPIIDVLGANSEDVAVGDLNGDGLDDAFFVNRGGANQVFMASAVGICASICDSGQRLGTGAQSIAVALGDLDGDGDLDAYEAVYAAGDRVWRNNGAGTFTNSGQALGSDGSNDVSLLDIDGDDDLDALVANNGTSRLWANAGNGTFTDSARTLGTAATFGLDVGDIDGDGDEDVYFANEGADTVWLLDRLAPNDPDSDDDGMSDGWEIGNGFDPFAEDDAELDADFDGLPNRDEFTADSDPRDTDSDDDGMSDAFEVRNGLDPGVDDRDGDLEGDGTSNLAEFQRGGDPQGDDTAPVVTAPANVAVNSTGALTSVPLGAASAQDARDGAVAAVPDNGGPFAPGRRVVTWSAQDVMGNVGEAQQTVDVTPLVDLAVGQVADEGDTVAVLVQLNGAAVSYPVRVDYSVAGVATNPQDHDAAGGSVLIGSGTSAGISIEIAGDNVFEGEETFTLTLDSAVNAVLGVQRSHTITITQANVRPVARIVVRQRNEIVTTAAANGGPITVNAEVTDPNTGDSHTYNWSGSDGAVLNPGDFNDASYSLDPAAFAAGLYRLTVDVADTGAPIALSRATSLLKVVAAPPVLTPGADTDGDGAPDTEEGVSDDDGDGVPNYQDPTGPANVLPLGADRYVLETQTGLALRLGEQAFAAGSAAGMSEAALGEDVANGYPNGIADFEILGVEPGTSATVVVPLRHPIPAGARYRKNVQGTWRDFVVDGANAIASAPGANGACPAPGGPSYDAGTNVGDGCVALTIEDGGPNDADAAANGVIRDPGGLAVPVGVTLEVVPTAAKVVARNATNVVAFALRLVSASGDVQLRSLTIQASGSGDDRGIVRVRLYADANGNGAVDAGEAEIAAGTFNQDNGTLQLRAGTPYAVPAGTTSLLVTYDF